MIYVAILLGVPLAILVSSILSWRLKWAILVPKSDLPPILLQNHTDWWAFLSWVSRRVTAFLGGRGDPVQLLGSNPKGTHQDIPAPGTWCLSWPFHFALRTKADRVFGLGIRRDYIDLYWTLRVKLGRV